MTTDFVPVNFIHVDGDVTIQLSQHAFDQDKYRVVLSQVGDGEIRREEFTDFYAAIKCYLGMIADELDQYVPHEIEPLVNR